MIQAVQTAIVISNNSIPMMVVTLILVTAALQSVFAARSGKPSGWLSQARQMAFCVMRALRDSIWESTKSSLKSRKAPESMSDQDDWDFAGALLWSNPNGVSDRTSSTLGNSCLYAGDFGNESWRRFRRNPQNRSMQNSRNKLL
jgi:hypothetical protein